MSDHDSGRCVCGTPLATCHLCGQPRCYRCDPRGTSSDTVCYPPRRQR